MRKISTVSKEQAPVGKLPLILYVEDDDDNWSVAQLRLQKSYRMLRAKNDREACELLKQHVDELYVVLMDIELKGSMLDGTDLTRLLRGFSKREAAPSFARDVPNSQVPVVFVTAYHTALTMELAAAGGDLVIPKPVRFMDLIQGLTKLHLRSIESMAPGGT